MLKNRIILEEIIKYNENVEHLQTFVHGIE